MEKKYTIEVARGWFSNEFVDCPDFIVLEFYDSNIKRVQEIQRLIREHKLNEVRISCFVTCSLKWEDGSDYDENSAIRWDIDTLIIHEGSIYFYMQGKHDCSLQFESKSFTANDILNEKKYDPDETDD